MSNMLAPPMLSTVNSPGGGEVASSAPRWNTSAPTSVPMTPQKYAREPAFLISIQKTDSEYKPAAAAGANANSRSATMPTPASALVMKYVTYATITMPMTPSAMPTRLDRKRT